MRKYFIIWILLITFIACRTEIEPPIVVTDEINYITSNSAIVSGEIENDGGNYLSAIGFELYKKKEHADSLIIVIGDQSSKFVGGVTNLQPNTTYYIRAFGKHNFGTGYGEEFEFTTENASIFIDNRDGNEYNEIVIGNKVWLGENLRYSVGECLSINDTLDDKAFYGNYYPLETIGNVCPDGWHLPTDEDWMLLERFIGMKADDLDKKNEARGVGIAESIMLPNFQLWDDLNYDITNKFGLAIPPSGYFRREKLLNENGIAATYWTAENDEGIHWLRKIRGGYHGIKRFAYEDTGEFYAVRCVKD